MNEIERILDSITKRRRELLERIKQRLDASLESGVGPVEEDENDPLTQAIEVDEAKHERDTDLSFLRSSGDTVKNPSPTRWALYGVVTASVVVTLASLSVVIFGTQNEKLYWVAGVVVGMMFLASMFYIQKLSEALPRSKDQG